MVSEHPVVSENGLKSYLAVLEGEPKERARAILARWKRGNKGFLLLQSKATKVAATVFVVIEYVAKSDYQKFREKAKQVARLCRVLKQLAGELQHTRGPYFEGQKPAPCGCFYPDVVFSRDIPGEGKRFLHCIFCGEYSVDLGEVDGSLPELPAPSEKWRKQERERLRKKTKGGPQHV